MSDCDVRPCELVPAREVLTHSASHAYSHLLIIVNSDSGANVSAMYRSDSVTCCPVDGRLEALLLSRESCRTVAALLHSLARSPVVMMIYRFAEQLPGARSLEKGRASGSQLGTEALEAGCCACVAAGSARSMHDLALRRAYD